MKVLVWSLAVLMNAGLVMSAVLPTSISREPLTIGSPSDRLSVGATYEAIKLSLDFDKGPDATLEASAVSFYLGYDIMPWLTLFATVGGSELDSSMDADTDAALKISGGASAYLWQGDLLTPEYLSGRLTLKATLEVSHYESDVQYGSVDWMDVTAALPFGYERFDEYPESPKGIDTSLAFYVGPAISYVNGSWDNAAGSDDFEAKQIFGAIAGLDIFLSRGLSFGVEANYFDETTVMGSVRFHL